MHVRHPFTGETSQQRKAAANPELCSFARICTRMHNEVNVAGGTATGYRPAGRPRSSPLCDTEKQSDMLSPEHAYIGKLLYLALVFTHSHPADPTQAPRDAPCHAEEKHR